MDEDEQIVYAEVYAPYTLDTYGDMMIPEDIKKMADDYMQRTDLNQTVDINHDNISTGSYPVESFIAEKDNPDYTEGAWVLGLKIVDAAVWQKIRNGQLAGYSMEVLAKLYPAVVEVDIVNSSIGITSEVAEHRHYFFVEMDAEGRVIGGRTSNDLGHVHEINYGTATELALGHKHPYAL